MAALLQSRESRVDRRGLGKGRLFSNTFPSNFFPSLAFCLRFRVLAFSLSLFAFPLQAQVTNTNTVTNGGTIGSGTVSIITNPVTSITGAITNNGSLIFAQTNSTVTDPFVISGSGSLTVSGLNGITILTAANTYTGSTVINAGSTLQIGTNGTTGSLASTNLVVNGALIYNLSSAPTVANIFTGSGSVTFGGNGNYTLTGTNRAAVTVIDTNARLSISSGTVFGSGQVVNNGGIAVTAATALSNSISGTGSLTISGNPVLITGSNSYSGVTWVSGGLTLSNTTGPALYANGGSGTIVLTSSTLALGFGAQNQLGSNVSIVFNATGAWNYFRPLGYSQTIGSIIQSNNPTWSVIENFNSTTNSTGTTTLTFFQTTNTTYSGFISDVGNTINASNRLALTKMGAATFTITSPQTVAYSGATTIGQGVFAAGSANALSPFSAFILSNNAGVSLNLNGFANTIASLAGGGSLGGNVLLGTNGVLTMGTNTTTTYSGVISGTGTAGITQRGTGTLILTANNTYTGTTTIDSGATIQVGTNSTNGSLGT
jgi:autotransporter-associated beta strand protein